jgi:hypothetical protein
MISIAEDTTSRQQARHEDTDIDLKSTTAFSAVKRFSLQRMSGMSMLRFGDVNAEKDVGGAISTVHQCFWAARIPGRSILV